MKFCHQVQNYSTICYILQNILTVIKKKKMTTNIPFASPNQIGHIIWLFNIIKYHENNAI